MVNDITTLARRLEPFLMQQVNSMSGLGGGLENKIHLIPSGTGAITTYAKDATGLAAAITASVSGDKIIIPNGDIGGTHTNKAGVEIIGWGQNTKLSGTITNNNGGILTNLQITGTLTNNGMLNHVIFPVTAVASGENTSVDATSDYGVVGGGLTNTLTGGYIGVIGGGFSNTILGQYDAILGGRENTIDADCYYCVIVGGWSNDINDDSATFVWYNFMGGGVNNLIQDAEWGVVVGGESNVVWGTGGKSVLHSSILGGSGNNVENSDIAAIAGGGSNEIKRGGASADSDYGFIGSGQQNKIYDSTHAAIAGGRQNQIGDATASQASHHSVIAGGRENKIAGVQYAAIPGGYQAKADKLGQEVYASGRFAATGDAQRSSFVVRRSVTHSTTAWFELFLDGSTARMTIAADTVWTFKIQLVGTSQGCAKSFGFEINGVIENDGGTTTLLASNVTTLYDTDDTSFDARVSADDTNDALLVEVTDADGASDVVRWVARVDTVEVTFP